MFSGRNWVRYVVIAALAAAVNGSCSHPEEQTKADAVEVSQRAISLNTGLIGYWDFEDKSGSNVTDTSGFGHHALIEGPGGHVWTPGKVGETALKLSGGRHARVNPTDTLDSPTNALSISGWTYRDTPAAGDEYLIYRRSGSAESVFHVLQGPSGAVCFSAPHQNLWVKRIGSGSWPGL